MDCRSVQSVEESFSTAFCNYGSWHEKCTLAVVSGTTLDGEEPSLELDLRMSAASVVNWELALQDSAYSVGLQMCKWKVGSLWPKAQDIELSRPRVPGGTGFTVS